jgi:thiosulfate/3-mercaptopyruvate sulfurtransferase
MVFDRQQFLVETSWLAKHLHNAELQSIFDAAQVKSDQFVVAYCNGGVAATTVLFSLAMLGYPNLTNYDGSWNERGYMPGSPC